MFRYYSSYALVYSNFTHLLCCGIPTIIGLSSLLTSFSFFETLTDKLEIFESYEVYLFALTTLIFMMFISAEIYKRRTNCTNEDEDICFADVQSLPQFRMPIVAKHLVDRPDNDDEMICHAVTVRP